MAKIIDDIVQVTITRATAVAKVASFNGVLIAEEFLASSITPAFGASERVRSYGSVAEITAAGFATSSAVYLAAVAFFAQNPNPGTLYVGRKLTGVDGSETWTQALAAIKEASNAWYGFTIGDKTLAELELAADWAETNDKLFVIADDDANIIDATGDIAEYVNTNDYDRTAVLYHPESDLTADDEMPEMAWMGLMFTKDPGAATWAFKNLTGVTAYELTTTQIDTAEGKKCNLYQEIASNNVTRYGWVGSGEFIDIIRGTDWLEARIQELVFTAFLNNDKIPFTDAGIQTVVSLVSAALKEAVDVGLITADYSISAPAAADVSAADKQARLLPDIEFLATYAGAIHKTQIAGTISL